MGLDGWKFLTEEDDLKLIVMRAMLEESLRIKSDLMERNAIQIANQVGKLFK